MNSNQIRQQFLSFYAARNHQIIPTVPLVAKPPDLMLQSNLWTIPFPPISHGQQYSPSIYSTILQEHISPNFTVFIKGHPSFFGRLTNWGNYCQKTRRTLLGKTPERSGKRHRYWLPTQSIVSKL
ncbi:MAG: hypothetical protein ACM37W_19505 [Actinomycetota bacterium]